MHKLEFWWEIFYNFKILIFFSYYILDLDKMKNFLQTKNLKRKFSEKKKKKEKRKKEKLIFKFQQLTSVLPLKTH